MVWRPKRQLRPLTLNPGGVVDPDDLVGRRDEVSRVTRATMTGGAKLLGDRRMGKTSILVAADRDLRAAGHTVIRVSAETHDPAVFSRYLIEELQKSEVLRHAWKAWETDLGGKLTLNVGVAGLELSASAKPGHPTSSRDFFSLAADAIRRTDDSHRLVFIFDEITVLARSIEKKSPGVAKQFFHGLRRTRQELNNVSTVIAGSVGLHHVLRDMSVVNDIDGVAVGPLCGDDAAYLAACQLLGSGANEAAAIAVAPLVAAAASGIPFYIQKLVEKLQTSGHDRPTAERIDALVNDALVGDEWETSHYESRIPDYYGEDAALVCAMLDIYATSAVPMGVDAVRVQLVADGLIGPPNRDHTIQVLDRLEADHYLVRHGDADEFATQLMRRIWRTKRRL